jgi:predicted nucleic acid-binding protein
VSTPSFRPDTREHSRARELVKRLRLGAFDALHVACAEALQAILVTVDRTFLARTAASARVRIRVVDPVQAVAELRSLIE